jgi:hypothetical protein
MKLALRTAVASVALVMASPALAGVDIDLNANSNQGTLVHGTGTETTALEVIANLGSNGPNIVHFNADTDSPVNDEVRLQGGSGQADVTGAEITPGGNPEGYNLISGNIFLTGHIGMNWIEFALTGAENGGTVDFWITLNGSTLVSFLDQVMGSGDTHFGFQATGGDEITNVFYVADDPPASFDILKQVRIEPSDPGAIPEPATWGMMLLGFGAAGFALRRRRKDFLAQVA